MEAIAKLPSRQFRTMLRMLSRGQCFVEAQALLRHRGACAGTELLADDVNTVLAAAVFCDPPRMINLYLSRAKKAGALGGLTAAAAVADFGRRMEAWDFGPYPDLADAAYARSPAIHADRAFSRKGQPGGAGGGAGAGGGVKRAREEGAAGGEEERCCAAGAAGAAGASEAEDGAPAPAASSGAAGASAAASSEAERAEAEAFKHLSSVLHEAFAAPAEAAAWPAPAEGGCGSAAADPTAARARLWLRARWLCALRLFASLSDPQVRALGPNARSLVLMLHAALTAGEVEECKGYLALLVREGGPCPRSELYTVLQPGMLQALAAARVLGAEEVQEALRAPENTPKWFFLKAAYEASKGDQFGSKHGAVITRGGVYLSHGHNHRYGVEGDKHIRVMHSEVHALVKLDSLAAAEGGEMWIVELDGVGVGYEEAVACIMCTKAATRVGIAAQHFSSHSGVRRLTTSHRPSVVCETLDLALRRVYPEGSNTENPDLTDEKGFSFFGSLDPGRGREAMRVAGASAAAAAAAAAAAPAAAATF